MAKPRLYAAHEMGSHNLAHAPLNGLETHRNGTGKRVALLVNGPSLSRMWREDHCFDFDIIVAMNTAGWLFPCDYMVVTDPPLVNGVLDGSKLRPRLGLVCYNVHQRRCHQMGVPWVELLSVPKAKPYTFPRAIVFALKQAGPNGTVEMFGVDWSAVDKDVAGVKGDHGPKRWEQEAEVVRRVWDARIVAVHGQLAPERLAYFQGTKKEWTL